MRNATRPAGDPFHVADEEHVVTAQKVFTPMGERLELTAETLGQSVSMDAIALESVSWQDTEEMAARAEALDRDTAVPVPELDGEERDEPVTVSSEFALARVTKVVEDGTELLHVSAPKLGYEIRLNVRELEWLATQDHETFTEWLETPFGPDADDHDHGH
ncbi:hypothetical protein [Haloarchaeobius sp. HRN-SO-5]|uniref:hypothetical protein n=1 Tax=Haloarchaeobius sp. HRN-SO-5 TaxID=3446118 RepID=UPI003EB8134F